VRTFIGTAVAEGMDVEVKGNVITFKRKNKVFRGRLHKDGGLFSFKRIS
jgi:hypothetical protein